VVTSHCRAGDHVIFAVVKSEQVLLVFTAQYSVTVLGYATALSREYITTSSVFKLGTSSLTALG
jgi:hypothetical protein